MHPHPNDELNMMQHKIHHRLDGTLNANTRNTAAILYWLKELLQNSVKMTSIP